MAYIKTNWIINKTPINADNLNKIENQLEILTNLQDQLLDIFYPIGSYYETSDTSFDPNVTWGGTWVEDSKGRVTVALDSNDTDFDTISETGGSKYLQKHSHTVKGNVLCGGTQGSDAKLRTDGSSFVYTKDIIEPAGTGNSGNLQPYIVVKRWHRTA